MKEQFLKRMQQYLQDEYEAYVETLQQEMYRGVRVNRSKITLDEFSSLNLCAMRPSTICEDAFYLLEEAKGLGNHPAHLAGWFYMQEPSASSAVEVLDVQKGDWVLDLCAAPGGKSTQIAAKLDNTGFLVSNEIEPRRAQVLMSNMERLGFSECMITNASPKELCKEMKGWFDRVLVDAPCSGEGMFKKHSKAMEDWSVEHVLACAKRQKNILDSAYEALKEDGILVYSTCTYAMEENEEVIYDFLKEHPDMELLKPQVSFGRQGFPYRDLTSSNLIRILPMDEGEGHFVAKMKKTKNSGSAKQKTYACVTLPPFVKDFLKQQIQTIPPYQLQLQDKVYLKQTPFLKLDHVRILRQGTCLGEIMKQRLEPHQHFYTSSIYEGSFQNVYDMQDEECYAYLKGNLLQISGYKGYVLLTWRNHPIAYGKGDGTVIKNKYPKGLRIKGI